MPGILHGWQSILIYAPKRAFARVSHFLGGGTIDFLFLVILGVVE